MTTRRRAASSCPPASLLLACAILAACAAARGDTADTPPVTGDGRIDLLYPPYQGRTGTRGIAWDTARERLVSFAGEGRPQGLPLTAEFDGTNWFAVVTQPEPGVAAGFAMVFDEARAETVLFGGDPASDATWTFDGTSWTLENPAHTPPARTGHAMAYDAGRQVVVLFGGYDGGTNAMNDTWEWDGTDWSARAPGTKPDARRSHLMAYHADEGKTYLYRGQVYGTNFFGMLSWLNVADMWAWDGSVWTDATPASMPTDGGPLAYDAAAQRLRLFGGIGGGSFNLWTYHEGAWSSASYGGGPATPGLSLAYTPSGTAYYLDYDSLSTRDWRWDGAGWTCLTEVTPDTIETSRQATWVDPDGDGKRDPLLRGYVLTHAGNGTTARGLALYPNAAGDFAQHPSWSYVPPASPGRVRAGDMNGDGRDELAIGFSSSRPLEVFYNTAGAWGAAPDWTSAGGLVASDLAWPDFDGDGDRDLAVLRGDTAQVAVMIYSNTGTALATSPGPVYTLPPAGDGAYARVPSSPATPGALMAWTDLDGDGAEEAVVSTYYRHDDGSSEYVLSVLDHDEANGVLVATNVLNGWSAPLAAGDVDGDGRPDLAAAAGSAPVLLAGTSNAYAFAQAWTPDWGTAAQATPRTAVLEDFDGDGDPDLMLSLYHAGVDPLGFVLFRNDAGTFGDTPDWVSTDAPGTESDTGPHAELVDVDGDGTRDLAANVGVYLLSPLLRDAVPPRSPRYVVGRSATPSRADVTVSWQPSPDADVAAYRVYRGFSALSMFYLGEVAGTATQFVNYAAAHGFDEYLVTAVDEAGNESEPAKCNPVGGIGATAGLGDNRPDASVCGNAALTGDLDGDGHPDLFVRRSHHDSETIRYSWATWLWSTGATTFVQAWSHAWTDTDPEPGTPVTAGDLDQDGDDDLVVLGTANGGRALLGFRSTAGALALLPHMTNALPDAGNLYAFAWGDCDGDNDLDLAVAGVDTNNQAAVYLNNGSGGLVAPAAWLSPAINTRTVAFGRLDGDARADLAVGEDVNGGTTSTKIKTHVHPGTASGPAASAAWSYQEASNVTPTGLSWEDYDQDGDDDLTVFSNFAAYLHKNTAGTLAGAPNTTFTDTGSNQPGHDLLGWGNLDGDAVLDLFGAHSVIPDAAGASASGVTIVVDSGWPSAFDGVDTFVARPWNRAYSWFTRVERGADFDGDGVTDLLSNYANLVFLGGVTTDLPAVITNLVVSPAGPLMLAGSGTRQALTVTAYAADGTATDVTAQSDLEVDNPDDGTVVVRAEGNELVAVSPGRALVKPQYGPFQGARPSIECYVAQVDPQPESLRLTPPAAAIDRRGAALTYTAAARLDNGQTRDVTPETAFSAEPATVAAMTGETAIAGNNGVATVHGYYGALHGTAALTVAATAQLEGLQLAPSSARLPIGGYQGFEVRARFDDDSVQPVTFLCQRTTDPAHVAAVSGPGVEGLSRGVAVLEASYQGQSAEAAVVVGYDSDLRVVLLEAARDGDAAHLRWFGAPEAFSNGTYTVYRSTNLVDGVWDPVAAGIARQLSGLHEWTGPHGATNTPAAFRVGILP